MNRQRLRGIARGKDLAMKRVLEQHVHVRVYPFLHRLPPGLSAQRLLCKDKIHRHTNVRCNASLHNLIVV